MNILDTIIAYKKLEVLKRKSETPITVLEKTVGFTKNTLSLKNVLIGQSTTGIIAEFKRQSPSKGVINDKADVVTVTTAYAKNGAAGLSVLTDEKFFGGSTKDFMRARINQIPLLRKDFIVEEYQLIEAKAMGADVILLIAACLSPQAVKELAATAKNLGLEVLLELHDEPELAHICSDIELVGINNRNLKTFEVNIERSLKMAEQIPADKIKIAESGISSVATINLFKQHGFQGFLMGENFMKEENPGNAFRDFVTQLNH
jgi:indole-3-glycerol phosphate synthase